MKEKKEFNFAQRWLNQLAKEKETPSFWKTRIAVWGAAGVLLLGVAGSTPWLWEYKLSRDIRVVEDSMSSLKDLENQVNQMKALKAKVESQEQLLKIVQSNTLDVAPVMAKLAGLLPAGAVVNSFSLQDNTLVLSVAVPTPVDVARLWVSLHDSGMFQGVDIQTVSLLDQAQTLNLNLTLK